jgi:hypothetical protein
MTFDPTTPPLSAFDDDDLADMLEDARAHPERDPQWLVELEAEAEARWG